MSEHTDSSPPAGQDESQESDPVKQNQERAPQKQVSNRRAALAAVLTTVARRLRQPLPGAQPRLRFEMPPELVEEPSPETETSARFGNPGPRMSAQHPLYVGFMGTVGVGPREEG